MSPHSPPLYRFVILLLWFFCFSISLEAEEGGHWAFQPLAVKELPPLNLANAQAAEAVPDRTVALRAQNPIDAFLLAKMPWEIKRFQPEADRSLLCRRLHLLTTGLPPSADELDDFLADATPNATSRLVDRLLASPQHGVRIGKVWLDAAGYADSNGYFNADSDRPYAYRYRDYVISSFNAGKPFDQFVREQLAGDQLINFSGDRPLTEDEREKLIATHYLRNGQDGTSESDGNPDEVTIDRATALENSLQIVMNSLLGITIQCARCHEHKFEPIDHREYYQLQATFYSAFPAFHADKWAVPKNRVGYFPTPEQREAISAEIAELEKQFENAKETVTSKRAEFSKLGNVLFEDAFEDASTFSMNWSGKVPGDESSAGNPEVKIDSENAPSAKLFNGVLQIIESGDAGDRVLATKKSFDWTPDREGDWTQCTFDLKEMQLPSDGGPAERIAFMIALGDFNDRSSEHSGGNILIDGNPGGPTSVHVDYPGPDSKHAGAIGKTGFKSGRNYGVRITRAKDGKFEMCLLVDGFPDEGKVLLDESQLPNGGFGFGYCCKRSFQVDNLLIQQGTREAFEREDFRLAIESIDAMNKLGERLKRLKEYQIEPVAYVSDLLSTPAEVHVLDRGSYHAPKEIVRPQGFRFLGGEQVRFDTIVDSVTKPTDDGESKATDNSTNSQHPPTRLKFSSWLTVESENAKGLVARVFVNRIWQAYFGTGIVATADNFGTSGDKPSHLELIEHLAYEFVQSGWDVKSLERSILLSAAFSQASNYSMERSSSELAIDSTNRLLWHFPLRRLESELVRDSVLAISDEIDLALEGPYVPCDRTGEGEVLIKPDHSERFRRSIYLQQRRTQTVSLLELFDSPAMVCTCGKRGNSTVALQSLTMLNAEFFRSQSEQIGTKLISTNENDSAGHSTSDDARLKLLARKIWGREILPEELSACQDFLSEQRKIRNSVSNESSESEKIVWHDLVHMLFASNSFLYIE